MSYTNQNFIHPIQPSAATILGSIQAVMVLGIAKIVCDWKLDRISLDDFVLLIPMLLVFSQLVTGDTS